MATRGAGRRSPPRRLALLLAAVSVATLLAQPVAAGRWGWTGHGFDLARLGPLLPIPLIGAAGMGLVFAGLFVRSHVMPFMGAVVVFLSGYLGLAAGFFPYIAPYGLTFRAGGQRRQCAGADVRRAGGDLADHPRLHLLGLLGVSRQDGEPMPAIIEGPPAILDERTSLAVGGSAWFAALADRQPAWRRRSSPPRSRRSCLRAERALCAPAWPRPIAASI